MDDEDFENSTKCWIFDSTYVDGDVKARDHCHITGNTEIQYIEIVILMLN